MTEEGPLEPVAPEPEPDAASAEPTQPVPTPPSTPDPATAGAPTWPGTAGPQPPAGAAPPAGSQPPGPPRSSTVAVPKWLVVVSGAVLFALIGFVIGWVAAPGGDAHTDVVLRPGSGLAPGANGGFFNGNGNGSGNNGGGATAPSTPRAPRIPRRGSAFLGVATSPSTDPAGARVVEVVPGSPAADGGLKADDVITNVDGRKVANPRQLATRIAAHQPNTKASITYVRNGATGTTSVTLTRRPGLAPATPGTSNPGS